MNLSILGFKMNVELLILIGVIFLILAGSTVGGCYDCNRRKSNMDWESWKKLIKL